MIVYALRDEYDDWQREILQLGRSIHEPSFYGLEDFGQDEEGKFVELKIEKVTR